MRLADIKTSIVLTTEPLSLVLVSSYIKINFKIGGADVWLVKYTGTFECLDNYIMSKRFKIICAP